MTNINSLPAELLDKIFGFLDQPAPSVAVLEDQPQLEITFSNTADLKSISCVSSRWRQAVIQPLFRHTRLIFRSDNRDFTTGWPAEYQSFLAFVRSNDLGPSVQSFTLEVEESPDLDHDDEIYSSEPIPNPWQDFFAALDPLRLTIIAPPPVLGLLTAIPVTVDVRPRFHMPYHILSLSRAPPPNQKPLSSDTATPLPTIFSFRSWDLLLLNEGSFIRAYSDPSYPHNAIDPPSMLSSLAETPGILPASIHLLVYVAIFPPSMHVIQLQNSFPHLRRLTIRFMPHHDILPDPGQMGGADLMLMEVERDMAYGGLVRSILDAGVYRAQNLEEIACRDVTVDGAPWREVVVRELAVGAGQWSGDPDRYGVLVKTGK
jgi:hypothetical protein